MSAQEGDLVRGVLTCVLGASAAAALALGIAARPWRERGRAVRVSGPPLAVALAAAAGYWATRGLPSFPPAQALHWLFYAALAGGAYGALEARLGRAAVLARALLAVALPIVLLAFQRERYWGRTEGVLWTAGLAALLFAAWSALARVETRAVAGGASALGLALATALAAGTYGLAGGALFAQLTGAVALGVGACALVGFWKRGAGLGAGGAAPYALLHHGLLWAARYLYELGTTGFVLLALVPLSPLLVGRVPASRPRLAAVLALALPTGLAAAALLAEWLAAAPSEY